MTESTSGVIICWKRTSTAPVMTTRMSETRNLVKTPQRGEAGSTPVTTSVRLALEAGPSGGTWMAGGAGGAGGTRFGFLDIEGYPRMKCMTLFYMEVERYGSVEVWTSTRQRPYF